MTPTLLAALLTRRRGLEAKRAQALKEAREALAAAQEKKEMVLARLRAVDDACAPLPRGKMTAGALAASDRARKERSALKTAMADALSQVAARGEEEAKALSDFTAAAAARRAIEEESERLSRREAQKKERRRENEQDDNPR